MPPLGFIVNPIAGMGGRVGLKGTDGEDVLREALRRGAKPWSPIRAREFLRHLGEAGRSVRWLTWSGEMGEELLSEAGYSFEVVGEASKPTTAEDTRRAARRMAERGVSLIVFAGGDGTACDIVEAIDMETPILGIPAGVKMFSAVFAPTPRAAAQLLIKYLKGEAQIVEREVMDIDEDAYRAGRLTATLKGYAKTPYAPQLLLSGKETVSAVDEELMKESIAARVVEMMRPGVNYILGPGSTVAKVAELLGVEKTLLGIDVVKDGRLIVRDASEEDLLRVVEEGETWIVLSPLGGQGSLLGRGNQPISPRVLRRVGLDHIIVIATPNKLRGLKALTIDTGDPELDEALRGYRRVITGYHEERVMRVI